MAHIPWPGSGAFKSDPVIIECCRKCNSSYQFKLESTEIVTVLCGRPIDQKYKAVSYLWERISDLPLKCRRCSVMTTIPMRDASKLWRIMTFVGGGSVIWLDAMSIDQNDPEDKAAQLLVMGDIYRNAETVSVLLPDSDEEAYRKLVQLRVTADAIVKRSEAFQVSPSNDPGSIATEQTEVLNKLADDYWTQMRDWTANIHKWNYWRRAWTFQEWAMAPEIEISWESAREKEYLVNIKNDIVMASTILGHWKKTTAMQSAITSRTEKLRQQIHLREELGRDLNAVRAHFPFEDLLVADEAEDPDVLRRGTFIPTMPMATDSGTYVSLKALSNPSLKFRSLLSLALNAINTSEREATYDADRVACWASMCNIGYHYDRHDSFAVALHKVTSALRRRGIKIYNFLVNTDSGETDLKFLDYAAAHHQTNAATEGYLFGTPIFIGRADTLTHVRHSLSQDGELAHLGGNSNVTLRQIDKVIIRRPVSWDDRTGAISAFRSALSGKVDGTRLFDVGDMIEKLIIDIPSRQLNKFLFVSLAITVADVHTMWYFNAWAICPSNINLADLFVARESLNGTLVLAVYKGPFSLKQPAKEAQIVSYLNMTHQRDGTYLVKADEKGVVDIVFRTVDTPQHELFWIPQSELRGMAGESLLPEWNTHDILSDRVFDMQINLGDREFSLVSLKGGTKI
jgi:Heterokaryon incompatibility protein (HET)